MIVIVFWVWASCTCEQVMRLFEVMTSLFYHALKVNSDHIIPGYHPPTSTSGCSQNYSCKMIIDKYSCGWPLPWNNLRREGPCFFRSKGQMDSRGILSIKMCVVNLADELHWKRTSMVLHTAVTWSEGRARPCLMLYDYSMNFVTYDLIGILYISQLEQTSWYILYHNIHRPHYNGKGIMAA